jgi:hypothetical protein
MPVDGSVQAKDKTRSAERMISFRSVISTAFLEEKAVPAPDWNSE